jgi:hypothetical protein
MYLTKCKKLTPITIKILTTTTTTTTTTPPKLCDSDPTQQPVCAAAFAFRMSYVILFSNFMHNFFIKSTAFLYMFLALLCSSSGGLNCIYTASGS